jgi:cyclase
MRIGSTVLLRNLQCVQSYGWNHFRPLGSLQGVLDSLEEYQCDEVAIIRPVRTDDSLECFQQDLVALQSLQSMTPISFGGGIRSLEHLHLLNYLPIERLIFSSAFINKDADLLNMAKDLFGHQAIQCLLPLCCRDGELFVYNSSQSTYLPFVDLDIQFINSLANEIVVVDMKHEGEEDTFDWNIINELPFSKQKIIISGGVGKQTVQESYRSNIASVLIDNKVLHKEYSILGLKNAANLS